MDVIGSYEVCFDADKCSLILLNIHDVIPQDTVILTTTVIYENSKSVMVQMVEALRSKPGGCGFDSRWGSVGCFLDLTLLLFLMCG